MKAILLAGGQGTRLRPLTLNTPKPVVPIFNRPFLTYQIDLIKQVPEIDEVVLSLNYQPEAIAAVFGDGSALGTHIRYVVEPEPLGTAGGLAHARPLLKSDPVLVVNGDTLVDVDLAAFVDAYRAGGAGAAIVCALVAEGGRYGRVELNAASSIQRFREKDASDRSAGWISAGVYLFSARTLDGIAALGRGSLERDVLERQPPGSILAFRTDGPFIDIGTPETLAAIRGGLGGFAAPRGRNR